MIKLISIITCMPVDIIGFIDSILGLKNTKN